MPKHLQREIDHLKDQLLSLGGRVEASVREAALAIQRLLPEAAYSVIEKDSEIDHFEVSVEEECLKILALYQPVAIDLRFIIAVLKINNDLERIGDLAVNIAERAAYLSSLPPVNTEFDFVAMSQKVQDMLKKSLDALVNMSSDLAYQVLQADDEVDAINRQMYIDVQKRITETPQHMEALIHLLSVSRHFERIGDHATNIAEDVIYMIQGEIVRHKAEDFRGEGDGPFAEQEG